LNSNVLDWFLKKVSSNFRGGYFPANKQFIEQLPVIVPDSSSSEGQNNYTKISDLARQIQEARANGDDASAIKLEQELNEEVCRLYNLSSAEIEMISNVNRKR